MAKKTRKGSKASARQPQTASREQEDLQPAQAETPNHLFPIVGVGASAGGLEAFTALLKHLPPDSGMAFVLIQHLDPKHSSQLSEILSKSSQIPVEAVSAKTRVKANHLYVISPGVGLTMRNGSLEVEPRQPGRYLPVDFFFRSLAQDRSSNAIGIVLSGTASDGTLGLKAIKADGGITFAQDPATAKFNGMPQSAISAGVVDFVLAPEEIAKRLIQLARNPYIGRADADGDGVLLADFESNRCFHLLRTTTGIDFTHYKPGTISRRIRRRMVLHGFEKLSQYIAFLQVNPPEVRSLADDLLIRVTSFFREPEMFAALNGRIFPEILKNRAAEDTVRIWVPGCATGEEAYSIAICLTEYLESANLTVPAQIFATDVSESAIEKARAGVYNAATLAELSAERVERFFSKTEGGFTIAKSIRDNCLFAVHNIIRDPPFQRLDLVSCCNVLIYLGPVLQRKALTVFHYALKTSAYLLLGSSEGVGAYPELFEQADKTLRVYTKVPTLHLPDLQLLTAEPAGSRPPNLDAEVSDLGLGIEAQKLIDRMLLAEYAPAGVVVDDSLRILQVRGHTGLYLELAPGEPSHNLLKMAREGLVVGLRTAFAKARQKKLTVVQEACVKVNGQFKDVNLRVVPLMAPVRTSPPVYVVLFEEIKPPAAPGHPGTGTPGGAREKESSKRKDARMNREIIRLNEELVATREYMQLIVEEQEASAEELKSANEEARATNEELETSKEELQSANEELNTVNDELKTRNASLTQANSDLANVLNSIQVPLLIVGKDLRIRRFTESMEPMLNLIDSDVGRSISDLKPNIDTPDLGDLLRAAINDHSPPPREVPGPDGRWYLMRAAPYRRADGRISGALLLLFDIDEIKHGRDYAQAIVETVRNPLVVLTKDLRVKSANQAFYETFRVSKEATEGNFFWDLGNGQWNIPALKQALEKVIPERSRLEEFEVEHDFAGIGVRTMLLTARALRQMSPYEETKILVSIENITDRKDAERGRLELVAKEHTISSEKVLREKDAELSRIARTLTVGELAASIAHEVNQPLAGVVTNAEAGLRWLGGETPDVEEARESLALIVRDGNRAGAIIRRIREFLRKENPETLPLDMREIVREAIALARSELVKNRIAVHLELSKDALPVRGDRVQLQQVILNLTMNACEAMAPLTDQPRELLVSAERSNDTILVKVRDSGVGIDPKDLGKMYDAFFTTKPSGMGMGLSISQSIVQAHGGRIWTASNEGPGLTLQFTLPAESEAPA